MDNHWIRDLRINRAKRLGCSCPVGVLLCDVPIVPSHPRCRRPDDGALSTCWQRRVMRENDAVRMSRGLVGGILPAILNAAAAMCSSFEIVRHIRLVTVGPTYYRLPQPTNTPRLHARQHFGKGDLGRPLIIVLPAHDTPRPVVKTCPHPSNHIPAFATVSPFSFNTSRKKRSRSQSKGPWSCLFRDAYSGRPTIPSNQSLKL